MIPVSSIDSDLLLNIDQLKFSSLSISASLSLGIVKSEKQNYSDSISLGSSNST